MAYKEESIYYLAFQRKSLLTPEGKNKGLSSNMKLFTAPTYPSHLLFIPAPSDPYGLVPGSSPENAGLLNGHLFTSHQRHLSPPDLV